MAIPALVLPFASCSGDSELEQMKKQGKTILNVATYDGGVGQDWIYKIKEEFEELYKDRSFNGGKGNGVYVNITGNKQLGGNTIENDSLKFDVYFTEMVDYYSFVNKDRLADISDIVTGEFPTEFNENGTIESKLDPTWKDFLTSVQGNKYYALPFYDGFYGIIYDVDLFDANGWYFDDEGDFVGKTGLANKSNGLDGVKGTQDDGLPKTYDEYSKLLAKIRSGGYTPFAYAGTITYVQRAMIGFWADYEGKEQMELNNTFNGTANLVSSIDGRSITTSQTTIDENNGYLLQKQAGKFYALDFLKNVFLGDTGNYYGDVINGVGYRDVQTNFVLGKYRSNEPTIYAMLVDGAWWEHEATSDFNLAKKLSETGAKENRRFAFMPIPKVREERISEAGTKQTLISQNNSYCFINKNATNMELAKLFLQFAHTDRQMANFTINTSVTRALNYEMDKSELDKTTYYGQSVYQMKKSSDVFYPVSSLPLVVNNAGYFNWDGSWAWMSNGKTQSANGVLSRIGNGESVESYFNGLSKYFTKNSWDSLTR